MLGIDQRTDFRRASLISEIYSESHGTSGSASAAAAATGGPSTSAAAGSKPGGQNGKKTLVAVRPPPPIPGMRRRVPKGKFGLIGLGKTRSKDDKVVPFCLKLYYICCCCGWSEGGCRVHNWAPFIFDRVSLTAATL